jgi:translation elongation factor EF-G
MGSDPMHFNIAVPLAFMRALKDCNMKIIEPIANFTIILPRDYLSKVVNHLSSFNSSFEVIMDNESKKVTIK